MSTDIGSMTAASPSTGAMPHPDDPGKYNEHMAAMRLVDPHDATHKAVRSGNWSDPDTWQNGRVPGEGAKVDVPHGVTVTYAQVSNASVHTIGISGKLEFATHKDTLLKVDTMVVRPDGELNVGTVDSPVRSGVSAKIVFADNGAVEHSHWDPMQLSRGLVAHGAVEMHGEEKTGHVRVAVHPRAGDGHIVLSEAPVNWQVGDTIVLAGTDLKPNGRGGAYSGTQDEVLTIKSISGATVTFQEKLKFDHTGPTSELKTYVANLTRNIEFSSENSDVHHRGHVMFMHQDDVEVRNVGFIDLGRTDKSEVLDDRILRDLGGDNYEARVAPLEDVSNPRGRYAVHLHRAGTDGEDGAALVQGSVVWGSPGWGFVSHDSNADFIDNVSFDVFGAHFVAETGNELGTWAGNIAIKAEGRTTNGMAVSAGVAAHDMAFEGDGFWLNGRLVEIIDNVAAGMRSAGFNWFGRGAEMIDTKAHALENELISQFEGSLESWKPALADVIGNETFASLVGLRILRKDVKQTHDERSVIDDFTGWEVAVGIRMAYTTNYLIKDSEFHAADHPRETHGWETNKNVESVTFKDVVFAGFDVGIDPSKQFDAHRIINNDPKTKHDHQYFLIDVKFEDVKKALGSKFDPAYDKVISSSDMSKQKLRLELDDQNLIARWDAGARFLELGGTKYDSLGSVKFPAANEQIRIAADGIKNVMANQGYWTLLDGTRVIEISVLFSDRGTAELKTMTFLAVLDKNWPSWSETSKYNGQYIPKSGVYISPSLFPAALFANSTRDEDGRLVFIGRDGYDLMDGTAEGDLIRGGGGDDVISGNAGADILYGGGGHDRLYGGAGDDQLRGAEGNDELRGGDGDDEIHAGPGDDIAFGEAGDDRIYGGAGRDRLYGGAGNDLLHGNDGDDLIEGGAGHDVLIGNTGNDTIRGQTGDDRIFGGAGDDLLEGGDGDDLIFGGDGNDRLVGGSGNDEFYGDAGKDIVFGNDGDDKIYGGEDDDRLEGGDGNDRLWGDGGKDKLFGQAGNDVLDGGAGDDELQGGVGVDRLYGGDGKDLLLGGDGDDQLYGQAGDDELVGGKNNDRLEGGDGNDYLRGEDHDDVLYGQAGDDLLNGGSGNDRLFGGEGRDVLIGGDGRDRLEGGAGKDTLTGGAGADVFVIGQVGTAHADVIKDFRFEDRLEISKDLFLVNPNSTDLDHLVSLERQSGSYHLLIDRDGRGSQFGFEFAAEIMNNETSGIFKLGAIAAFDDGLFYFG
jgi:Ca2+-binding RTX toxin-like protein